MSENGVTMKTQISLVFAATVAMAGVAEARDQVRVVGSSTVFPYSQAVAEKTRVNLPS